MADAYAKHKVFLISILLGCAAAAVAHEFWLQPISFRVAVGAKIPLKLLVGSHFAGEAWPRPTRRVQRFVRVGPAGAADSTDLRPALLADSVAPAFACPTAGTHLVVLLSAPSFTELPAVGQANAGATESASSAGRRSVESAGLVGPTRRHAEADRLEPELVRHGGGGAA
ncbi:MAG: hypothetical protein EOO36_11930 [Cytophagaceae bacterium]|nr:MAG: hypothetical protein EOO36_11930 [Cytophagaceae bacterium]